jgi:hypothetical protein
MILKNFQKFRSTRFDRIIGEVEQEAAMEKVPWRAEV